MESFKKSMLEGFSKVFLFVTSPQFSLRVIEILAIVVIQRNNNIFSLVSLLWLAIISTVENERIVLKITGWVMMPL